MPRWIHHLGWMFEGCVQFTSTEPRTAGSVVVPIPESENNFHVNFTMKTNKMNANIRS